MLKKTKAFNVDRWYREKLPYIKSLIDDPELHFVSWDELPPKCCWEIRNLIITPKATTGVVHVDDVWWEFPLQKSALSDYCLGWRYLGSYRVLESAFFSDKHLTLFRIKYSNLS